MATLDEELEDLVTCSVCLLEYNQDERKPKYLQCYHVLCLQCLTKIARNNSITCPICRISSPCPRGAVNLTTSTRVLQMVEFRKVLEQQSSRALMWCLTCASLAGRVCRKSHCTIDLTSKAETDCKDMNEAVDKCQSRLTATISKKQTIRHSLGKILDSLKDIENDIKGKLDEDDMQLAQMMSNLESLDKTRTSTETFQSLKAKIEASIKFTDQEDRVMETSSKTRDMLNQTRIMIQLEFPNGQKTTVLPLFKDYFGTVPETIENNQKSLLTHLIFSVLDQQDHTFYLSDSQSKSSTDDFGTNPNLVLEPSSVGIRDKWNTFILKFSQDAELLGKIFVKPSATFDPNFIEYLVQFCYLPTTFTSEIKSATADPFVILDFRNPRFRPSPLNWPKERVECKEDVGVVCVNQREGEVQWQLIFFAESADSDTMRRYPLFGKMKKSSRKVVETLVWKRVLRLAPLTVTWSVLSCNRTK